MSESDAARSLDELTLGKGIRLEELVDRGALAEMVDSFYELFGIGIRMFTEDNIQLADAGEQPEIYTYLNGLKNGRVALQSLVTSLKAAQPSAEGDATFECFSGALYRIVGIEFDQRRIGRVILGPFLPLSLKEVPASLIDVDPELDPIKARELLTRLPRAREETVAQIARHLRGALDLILFSGHKALLTTNMHLATVRESYRELKQKNEDLQEAYERLKELDRLKSNFLATVSHELRTPLTSIIGYSEMLLEAIAGDLTDEQKEFVQTIHEKGDQLLQLISGLLDLSKLESGTMSITRSEVDAGELIRDVAQTLQPTARKKGVEVVATADGELPLLWADPSRLRQVLLNLSENAIKFTPENGTVVISAHPTVMAPTEDEEDAGLVLLTGTRPAVELRVADSGIGIPSDEREKVFDAFYQVDSSSTREAGGTGLGLSIVKRLVDAHDGVIRVEENEPRGTVFSVTIPVRRATIS